MRFVVFCVDGFVRVVKIMYDFSDELKENNLLKDEDNTNDKRKQFNSL